MIFIIHRISTLVNVPLHLPDLTIDNLSDFDALDHVFHTNIIADCQQNWYVRLATYTNLFTLSM